MNTRKTLIAATVFISTLIASVAGSTSAYAVERVSFAPVPTSAQAAGTQITLVVTLDEPIICPETCTLTTVRFSSSDTATASISQSELSWTASQWMETRTITVTVAQSLTYDSSSTVRFRGLVHSLSEYYRNFASSFTINVAVPVKPQSIPDPKQKSVINEYTTGPLSDASTTTLNFKGKFIEPITSIHLNGKALSADFWTQSENFLVVRVPKTSGKSASLQIYNGSVPVLFDKVLEVSQSKMSIENTHRVKIVCKGKKVSRTIYGISPVCPPGYSLIK